MDRVIIHLVVGVLLGIVYAGGWARSRSCCWPSCGCGWGGAMTCEHSESEHAVTRRLVVATWGLCAATALRCVVTILLVEATWAEKQQHELTATHEATQR